MLSFFQFVFDYIFCISGKVSRLVLFGYLHQATAAAKTHYTNSHLFLVEKFCFDNQKIPNRVFGRKKRQCFGKKQNKKLSGKSIEN